MPEATFAYLSYEKQEYPVLVHLSTYYSRHKDRLSTRYSPVRHSTQDRSPFRVRLACVKHAASVRSEPGSNSPVLYPSQSQMIGLYPIHKPIYYLARSYYCSVFKDQSARRTLRVPARQQEPAFYLVFFFPSTFFFLLGFREAAAANVLGATRRQNTGRGPGCQRLFPSSLFIFALSAHFGVTCNDINQVEAYGKRFLNHSPRSGIPYLNTLWTQSFTRPCKLSPMSTSA